MRSSLMRIIIRTALAARVHQTKNPLSCLSHPTNNGIATILLPAYIPHYLSLRSGDANGSTTWLDDKRRRRLRLPSGSRKKQ
ncbi:hypothetical protein EV2_022950 [Malus domestica]